MAVSPDNALVLQSDCSLLLELHSPRAEEAREAIAPFAELVEKPRARAHLPLDTAFHLECQSGRACGR